MDADKFVMHEVDRDGMGVVLDLLREPVRQAREPAHPHAHREVLALGVGRADVLGIGAASGSPSPRDRSPEPLTIRLGFD